jgi:hypothetical protein
VLGGMGLGVAVLAALPGLMATMGHDSVSCEVRVLPPRDSEVHSPPGRWPTGPLARAKQTGKRTDASSSFHRAMCLMAFRFLVGALPN